MLGRGEKIRPGFDDSPNFAQSLVLLVGRLFLRPGVFENPPGRISPGL